MCIRLFFIRLFQGRKKRSVLTRWCVVLVCIQESHYHLFSLPWKMPVKKDLFAYTRTHTHTFERKGVTRTSFHCPERDMSKRDVYTWKETYIHTPEHTHTHTHIRESLAPLFPPLKETNQKETYAHEKRPIQEGSFTSFLFVFYLFPICFVYIPEPHTCVWVRFSFHSSQEEIEKTWLNPIFGSLFMYIRLFLTGIFQGSEKRW